MNFPIFSFSLLPTPEINIYRYIYIVPNTLFSPNQMIITTGTFRNTSITLKLYEITLFPTGSSAYQIIIQFTKALSHRYADETRTSNGLIFIVET